MSWGNLGIVQNLLQLWKGRDPGRKGGTSIQAVLPSYFPVWSIPCGHWTCSQTPAWPVSAAGRAGVRPWETEGLGADSKEAQGALSQSCELQEQDGPVPGASVCFCPGCGCVPSRDLATALGRDSLSQPHPWALQPTALNCSEQSWPRTSSGMTPRTGEAEKPISAGLAGAVGESCSSGVSLSHWHSSPVTRPGKLLLKVMSECEMRIY